MIENYFLLSIPEFNLKFTKETKKKSEKKILI
jgi:hypothetical protein